MRSQPVMSALVDRFEAMRLANFLQHRCDWNETVICQFYATLEINMVEERIWWTTGKRTYYATFAQFAAANQLDNDFITNDQSVNVVLENPLDENDYPCTISLQMLVLLGVLGAFRVLGIILLS